MSDAKTMWNDRYAASELVWSAGPNLFVEEMLAEAKPGRVLDIAGGEGRNSLWLAELGWEALIVDISDVALDRAGQLAEKRLGENANRIQTQAADLMEYRPEAQSFDLVLASYFHAPAAVRTHVLRMGAEAVAPGGELLVIGHDLRNLTEGVGGPQDPSMLFTPADVQHDLVGIIDEFEILQCETVRRAVSPEHADQPDAAVALDVIFRARRI